MTQGHDHPHAAAGHADPAHFRAHLRAPDDPRIAGITPLDARAWAERTLRNPRAAALFGAWEERYQREAFVGISTDGTPVTGLFPLRPEGAPTDAMIAAVERVLACCTPDERTRLVHAVDDRAFRGWMNPEVYVHRFGLRLEELAPPLVAAILDVLRASLSPRGYERARNLMRINHFLGELVNAPGVLNELSYNFNLFGTPSATAPWGWNFYGHHLCLNCLVVGGQMVTTPVFMGAEPNCIDVGPHAGLSVFDDEERMGLELVRALAPAQQRQAILYPAKRDPAMPPGRIAIGDELHLGGAFQDNRVIPFEGAGVRDFAAGERRRVLDLVASYLGYLPAGPFAARMDDVERHLDATHFCWIGGTDDASPFYYRIQSPVLLVEFDHHAGVFLANTEPAKFHIHTIVRTPNGNDYGMALLEAHCEAAARRSA